MSLIPTKMSRQLIHKRDLLFALVARDIKLRYKRSVLGIAWSLVTPLAQLAVYYFVFTVLLPLNVPNYVLFLFSGVLVWSWFQMSLFQATSAIVDNRELIKRTGFPAAILPTVTVTSNLIHFLVALPILFVLLALGGGPFTLAILALPVVIVLQFALTLSLAYFTATFYVAFRDTQYLLGVLLNLLFFLTPIFYKVSDLPQAYQKLYHLNPMVHMVEFYRFILMLGKMPDLGALMFLTIPTIGILFLGHRVFTKASARFVDEL